MVKIAEVPHGPIVPIGLVKKGINCGDKDKRDEASLKARGKCSACTFMKSVDWCGTCVEGLNNACGASQNNCPAAEVEAVSHLSNCMDSNNDKGKGKTLMIDKDIVSVSSACFHTSGKHCFNCGNVRYTKKTCPVCKPKCGNQMGMSHVSQANFVMSGKEELPI